MDLDTCIHKQKCTVCANFDRTTRTHTVVDTVAAVFARMGLGGVETGSVSITVQCSPV